MRNDLMPHLRDMRFACRERHLALRDHQRPVAECAVSASTRLRRCSLSSKAIGILSKGRIFLPFDAKKTQVTQQSHHLIVKTLPQLANE
jgi:hypothetical protein